MELEVLAFFDSSHKLAALAPLELVCRSTWAGKWRELRLMGDGSGDSDNLDLPVRPGCEERFATDLLSYLGRRSKGWDFCRLNTLPSESAGARGVLEQLKAHNWTYFSYGALHSVVPLPGDWQTYLQQLSSKERGKIRTRTGRLHKRYNVHFFKCASESQLPGLLEAFYEMHQRHWEINDQPGSFKAQVRRDFYGRLAAGLLRRGWLEFWILQLNEKVVAAQFGFRYRETMFSLQEGFDPDYSSDSVGYVLRAHVMEELIATGVRQYDFLGGRDASKTRWAASSCQYLNIHFARPFSRGSLCLRLTHDAGRSKEWLRGHLHPFLWRVLHATNLWFRRRTEKSKELESG
ncbi:MAG: GNAT family N-acetyltransferase [Candidatus Sulfotelmatobacter sp.]